MTEIKDSGSRTTFVTGAQRDRQKGKGKPSLFPNWVMWLVSCIYEDGAAKYAARNWEKGMGLGQYLDSAERHLGKLKAGLRDEPHASQVLWNMIGYVFTAWMIKIGARPAELNDMWDQIKNAPAEPLADYEYTRLKDFFAIQEDLQPCPGVKPVEKNAA
jgi:dATP/dGTP diphosphohydrolase